MPEPVPLARVKELLAEEAARRTLPREAALAHQHAELFARLDRRGDRRSSSRSSGPSRSWTPRLAVKIADVLPQYPEEIRLLFSKERVALDEAQVARLLEIVAQHR